MLQGGQIGEYAIQGKVGQGSYGQIFTVKHVGTGKLYAAKVEPDYVAHKTVEFEARVIKRIHGGKYFPSYVTNGRNPHFSYLIMDLLGPSLTVILRKMQSRQLSLSSGIRIAFHSLSALEELHEMGYCHRDIKPSNMVINENNYDNPVVMIDFGMAKYYLDKSKNHLPERKSVGFRGTALYASIRAHLRQDLSRRDDLVSWYYTCVDFLTGELPWRMVDDKDEILKMKQTCTISSVIKPIVPEMGEIWELINILDYADRPNYERMKELLLTAMEASNVNMNDPYDWEQHRFPRKSVDSTDPSVRDQTQGLTSRAGSGDQFSDSVEEMKGTGGGCCAIA